MSGINILTKNDCVKFVNSNEYSWIHPLLNEIIRFSDKPKPDMCCILPQIKNKKFVSVIPYHDIIDDLQINFDNISTNIQPNVSTNMSTNVQPNVSTNIQSNIKQNTSTNTLTNTLTNASTNISTNTLDDLPSYVLPIVSSEMLLNVTSNDVCNLNPVMNFSLPINSNNFLDIVFRIETLYNLDEWINNLDFNDDVSLKLLPLALDLFWKNNYNKIDEELDFFMSFNRKILKIIIDKPINKSIALYVANKLMKHDYGKEINYINQIKKYYNHYLKKIKLNDQNED